MAIHAFGRMHYFVSGKRTIPVPSLVVGWTINLNLCRGRQSCMIAKEVKSTSWKSLLGAATALASSRY